MTGGSSRIVPRHLGLDDHELAAHQTVYREGLLDGHAMLISGGGGGMGRATAYLAARLGARVMISGRSEERLKATADGIRTHLKRDVPWKAMTIREPDEVAELLDEAWRQFGRLDTLVNSAGGQFTGHSLDFTPKGWRAVVDTNLNGTWWMMQAAARKWRDAALPGNIVNVASVISRVKPHVVHNAAARAGVVHMSRSVAVEWAPLHIRVNCVAPGAILSDGVGRYSDEHRGRLPSGNPMRRMGDTWDIAESIVYLTAPSGKFITGELLHVDGGGQLWGDSWLLGIPEWFKVDQDA